MEAFFSNRRRRACLLAHRAAPIVDLRAQLRKVADPFATRTGRSVAAMIAANNRRQKSPRRFGTILFLKSWEEGQQFGTGGVVARKELRGGHRFRYDTRSVVCANLFPATLIGHGALIPAFTDSILEHALFGLAKRWLKLGAKTNVRLQMAWQVVAVNKVILIGCLGRDAETAFTAAQIAIVKFSVATSMRWKDKGIPAIGRKKPTGRIYVSREGENVAPYLLKGNASLCRRPPAYAQLRR